ncbi:hypothetical protein SDC9_193386 [bioreactor metagenome]|uniref:Uncharacterized protein n=1 Tax=bioreactor metagenome TaxID=1076179 RepID=A0A645IBZ1_9ZZZZ
MKLRLKCVKLPVIGELSLQLCKKRQRAAEALHFIEHLHKYVNDGVLVALDIRIAFRVDVK